MSRGLRHERRRQTVQGLPGWKYARMVKTLRGFSIAEAPKPSVGQRLAARVNQAFSGSVLKKAAGGLARLFGFGRRLNAPSRKAGG